MDPMQIIKLSVAQLRDVETDVKEVKVTHLPNRNAQSKQCFNNAFNALKGGPDQRFVLGYYLLNNQLPIEHAWIKDGSQYLDVTLAAKNEDDMYISVLELTWAEVYEYVQEYSEAPDLFHYDRFMRKHKNK